MVPSGYNPNNYVTYQLVIPAYHSQLVPVSLLYRSNIRLDGNIPYYLYSYGLYGIVLKTEFNI